MTSEIDVEHVRKQFLSYYKSTDETEKICTLKVLFKALSVSDED